MPSPKCTCPVPSGPSHIHFPPLKLRQGGKYTMDTRINMTPGMPHSQASRSPDDIDATPMDQHHALPYKWICKLQVIAPAKGEVPGRRNDGTGFLINLPGTSKCVVLTARHVLAVDGATHVVITFPGAKADTGGVAPVSGETRVIEVCRQHFRYMEKRDTSGKHDEWDYGVILLPDAKLPTESCGFGFHAAMLDRGLLEADLTIVGYPGSQMDLWGSGGRTQSVGDEVLKYILPTSPGQSGAPVFIWHHGMWMVVGIHVRSEQRVEWVLNFAVRLTVSVMKEIVSWIGDYQYLGRSIRVGDHYLRRADRVFWPAARGLEFYAPDGETGDSSVFTSVYGHDGLNDPDPDQGLFDFIPVHAYPEGSSVPYSATRWVILCRRPGNNHVALCIDPYAIGGVVAEGGYVHGMPRGTSSIGTCEHLRANCILRRAPEFVVLTKHKGDPEDMRWGIRSVRFPELPLRVMKAMRWNDGKDTWGLDKQITNEMTAEEVFKDMSFDIAEAECVKGIEKVVLKKNT